MDERWITDGLPEERFPAWTRGNAADVFPDPVTPLMWTFYGEAALAKGVRDAYISFGMMDWNEFENPNDAQTFGCFGGYFYNPLSMVRLFGARMPGATPEAIDRAYFDEHPDVPPYVAEPWHDSPQHAEKLTDTMVWAMSTTALPELDLEKELADRLRTDRPDLTQLSDAALLARARSIVPYLQQAFETGMVVSTAASLGPGALGAICQGLGDETLTIRLLAGIDVDSAKPSFAMWDLSRMVMASPELADAFPAGSDGLLERLKASGSPDAERFLAGLEAFLEEYGSRGPKEWDLNAKVWELYPHVALGAIGLMRMTDESHSPRLRHDASIVERDRVAGDIRAKLAGDTEALAAFEAALRSSQVFLAGRERYKTNCVKLVHEIRMCFVELGRRMVDRGVLDDADQVFMLLASELDQFRHEPERLAETLRQRERDYLALYDLEPPFIVNGRVPPMSQWPHRVTKDFEAAASGTVLKGTAGSGGVAVGRARIVLDASDVFELDPGDVLIAPQTDPSWVPLFITASAVVVNVGAAGSHSMIVSRELGIPCVVSVADATLRIPDGAQVTVDGNAGTVTVH